MPETKAKAKSGGFKKADGVQAVLDGEMWPVSFALTNWSPAVEKQVTALVKSAAS